MKELISVEHLSYAYPGVEDAPSVPVFSDLNLKIEEGSFVAILGTNGCGKSTLAKHFNSILLPSGGKVYVCGIDTSNEERIMAVRRNVGMVFQNPDNQIVANVVEEDVAFGPENLGIASPEIRNRVDKALKQVDMYAYREHSPHLLSGGQKQRIAIARVIAVEPRCIVLDEPTAMLDPNGRKEVLKAVRELNEKEGVTVILITHYMEEVVFADKVFVMDQGHIVMQGTPREVFSRVEELKELRLDVPQVTLLAYELKQAGVDLPDGILTIEELVNALCQ